MSKKVIFGVGVGLMSVAIGVGAYALGSGSKTEDKISPTPTPVVERVVETQLTGSELTISLLEEKQAAVYATATQEEELEVNGYGVYFAQYEGKNAIFQFATFYDQNQEPIDNPNLGYVTLIDQDGQNADAVDFFDLDMPIFLYDYDDVDSSRDWNYGTFVLNGTSLFAVGYPVNMNFEPGYDFYNVVEFDLETSEMNIIIDTTPIQPNEYKYLVAADQSYLVFDIFECTACDEIHGSPTDFVVYNIETKAEITIEDAGFYGFDLTKGQFIYRLDVGIAYECSAEEIANYAEYCGTVFYDEQGGDKMYADLP